MDSSPFNQQTCPSLAELEKLMMRLGLLVGPVECHGMLCGQLCASKTFDQQRWLAHIIGEDRTDDPAVRDCVAVLEALVAETIHQLGSMEIGFQPLLPDDDQPIRVQIAALSEWCQGFLFGLGFGNVGDLSQLSVDSYEFLQDLNKIARIGPTPGAGEEEEAILFTEMVEYIKIGVLLLREDLLYKTKSE